MMMLRSSGFVTHSRRTYRVDMTFSLSSSSMRRFSDKQSGFKKVLDKIGS